MKEEKTTKQKTKVAKALQKCNDRDCPSHGNLKTRGRFFEGEVISKGNRRVAIYFERMVHIRKYERFSKSKTKIHARLPKCLEDEINKGDIIKIQECRPLSKIIHFVVVKKIKDAEKSEEKLK